MSSGPSVSLGNSSDSYLEESTVCVCVFVCVFVCVCMCVCVRECVCTHVGVCVWRYCMCGCVGVHVYVYCMLEHKRRVQCTVHMQCMLCWV